MARTQRFPSALPKAGKSARGRTAGPSTPLTIRSRVPLEPELREAIRERYARRLSKYAQRIQRASLRIEDVNGPRGGIDMLCRVKVVLSGAPSVVVESRAAEPFEAAMASLGPVAESVRRSTSKRAGVSADSRKQAKVRAAQRRR